MTLIYTQTQREKSSLVNQWIQRHNPTTTQIKAVTRDHVLQSGEFQSQEDWFQADTRQSQTAYKGDGLSRGVIRESRMIDVVERGGKNADKYRGILTARGYELV